MPLCPVCDGIDYEEVDGLFYCITCNTQSQALRNEETDANLGYADMGQKLIQQASHFQYRDKDEEGIPWFTEDALHIILRCQAGALIKKGISKKIKGVIHQLWLLYLARSGIVKSHYCQNPQELQLFLNQVPRNRDQVAELYHLILDDCLEMDANPNSNEPGPSTDTNVDADGDPGNKKEKGFIKMSRASREVARRSIGRLRLTVTISICHLALLYINNLVTTSDLYTWLQDNSLPYRHSEQLLPKSMVLTGNDRNIFTSSTIPPTTKINKVTTQLIKFLELRDFPVVDLRPLAVKYVWLLHLPGELHGIVQRLLYYKQQDYTPVSWLATAHTIVPVELLVMAHIIVAIKMMMCLDDNTEWTISNYAKELNTRVPGLNLFVWRDWLAVMESKIDPPKLPNNTGDVLRVLDTKILDEVPCLSDDHFNRQLHRSDTYLTKETRNLLEHTFTELGEKHPRKRPYSELCSPKSSEGEGHAKRDRRIEGSQSERTTEGTSEFPLPFTDTLVADSSPINSDDECSEGEISFRDRSLSYLTSSDSVREHVSNHSSNTGEEEPELREFHAYLHYWIGDSSYKDTSKSYQKLVDIAAKLLHYPSDEVHGWVFKLERVLLKEEILEQGFSTNRFWIPINFPGHL